MSRADRFDFTLDEETEKRLYDLMTDIDTRRTNRFWIKDKHGYHAEYVKIVRCKDCYFYIDGYCDNNVIYQMMSGDLIGVHFEPHKDFYCSLAERRTE